MKSLDDLIIPLFFISSILAVFFYDGTTCFLPIHIPEDPGSLHRILCGSCVLGFIAVLSTNSTEWMLYRATLWNLIVILITFLRFG